MRTRLKMEKEAKDIMEGNRVYYVSERLNLEPVIVSKYFATHMFMFEITLEMLVQNLNIMLEYKISSMSIVRDLWAFKYLPRSIRSRLERCKNGSKENMKPWMIRCTEDVLQRTLFLSKESNKILLGEHTYIDYLTERLGYDKECMNIFVKKHDKISTVRVTKVKFMNC
jgi:hypothetical protein